MQNTGNSAVFCSGSAHLKNFWNFSRQQSPLPRHLWLCYEARGYPLYITGIMVQFMYYKNEVLIV